VGEIEALRVRDELLQAMYAAADRIEGRAHAHR
jgi:hypothetical protein